MSAETYLHLYPVHAARKIIKYTWNYGRFEFITRKNRQHAIKKQIIVSVSPEFLEYKKS